MTHFSQGTSSNDKVRNAITNDNYIKAKKYYCAYKVFSKLQINIVVTYDSYNSGYGDEPPYIYAEYNEKIMYANGHIIYADDVILVLPVTPQNHIEFQKRFGEYLI